MADESNSDVKEFGICSSFQAEALDEFHADNFQKPWPGANVIEESVEENIFEVVMRKQKSFDGSLVGGQ